MSDKYFLPIEEKGLSGKRITQAQENIYMKNRQTGCSQETFAAVWESELIPLLEKEPSLTGIALWEHLDEHHPGTYPEKLLRTLQRRVKHWRATLGPQGPLPWLFCCRKDS